jgi:hypothetical protein
MNKDRENMNKLSEIQKETYNYIKEVGQIQTTNLPDKRMWGTIPNLVEIGLVEIFKKYTSYFRKRKKKFVRIAQ